jgi:hypothetical protein
MKARPFIIQKGWGASGAYRPADKQLFIHAHDDLAVIRIANMDTLHENTTSDHDGAQHQPIPPVSLRL